MLDPAVSLQVFDPGVEKGAGPFAACSEGPSEVFHILPDDADGTPA